MAEIIKTYRQEIGPLRFIGSRYDDADRMTGKLALQWNRFLVSGWFERLESLAGGDLTKIYEDGDAYISLMRHKKDEPMQYWIGMFLPAGTEVPEGFDYVDFSASNLGVCWVYGPDSEVVRCEGTCIDRLVEGSLSTVTDSEGAYWAFVRYQCPRFTTPDEKGNVILDICHFVA